MGCQDFETYSFLTTKDNHQQEELYRDQETS